MDFAKGVLKDHEQDWKRFPIYLKATAGMRQLSYDDREAVLAAVRDFLGNPETCPFYFQFDQARAISGEEVSTSNSNEELQRLSCNIFFPNCFFLPLWCVARHMAHERYGREG